MDIAGAFMGFVELGCMGFGMYSFVAVLLARSRGIRSKSWPVVEGIITGVGVVTTPISVGEYAEGEASWRKINYLYEFGGARYTSDRISFEGRHLSVNEREFENWPSRYQRGSHIKVSCNPEKPQESVLEPGFRAKALLEGLCRSLVLIGIAVLWFFSFTLPKM